MGNDGDAELFAGSIYGPHPPIRHMKLLDHRMKLYASGTVVFHHIPNVRRAFLAW